MHGLLIKFGQCRCVTHAEARGCGVEVGRASARGRSMGVSISRKTKCIWKRAARATDGLMWGGVIATKVTHHEHAATRTCLKDTRAP